jgi:site-specific recombinase XerD
MDSILHLHSNPKSWLLGSDLAPHVDAYVDYLELGQYSNATINTYVACVAHFARWQDQCGLEIHRVDEEAIRRFLGEHLAHCDCPAPVCRRLQDLRPACRHLLHVLRDNAVISKPEPRAPHDSIEEELQGFDEHMRCVRGLAPKTRQGRIRIVERLLRERFAAEPLQLSALQPDDVRQFMAEQLQDHGTTTHARALASALRAYFRYQAAFDDHADALASAVSSPAEWSLSSLPRSLSDEEVRRLLGSFTPDLPSYRRGYAMVRCGLDMGLRSSEIAKLARADIDWHAGTVTLRSTKSGREDLLPLPAATGQAIVDYLRFERPAGENAAVFVRHIAPRGVPIGPDAVRRVIRDAYRRIGLTHGRSHALRHTVARRLLEQGSSLKEVADVLRHRSLNTSLIYAKLDSRRLLAVALPWPGSTS